MVSQNLRGKFLPINPAQFFGTNTEEIAQGDIFKDVPFVRPELDRNLILLRPEAEDRPILSLEDPCDMTFANETDVQAFPKGATEQCVLPVDRIPAMLLTPTCNVAEDYWLFSPLRSVEAQPKINRATLHSTTKGYGDLFGIYAHAQFEESYISFHDLVSVPAEPFRYYKQSRIANLSKETQRFLEDKAARFLSRGWGYATYETVEIAGFYRCRVCTRYYGLDDKVVYLNAGDHPPKCKNCAALKLTGAWELLLKHKKSKQIEAIAPRPNLLTRALRFLRITKA